RMRRSRRNPSGESGDERLAASDRRHLAGNLVVPHDHYPMRKGQDFVEIARNENDRDTAAGGLDQRVMDDGAGADVDAPRRLEHDKDTEPGKRQVPRDYKLLLVAAAEPGSLEIGVEGMQFQPV